MTGQVVVLPAEDQAACRHQPTKCQIQAERRETEAHQLDKAAKILKMHDYEQPKRQRVPYNPAENGFVFSLDEIES